MMWRRWLRPLRRIRPRLDELAGLYAKGSISAREWIAARDPITARINHNRREIAQATDTSAVYELAGTGGALRKQWPDLDLGRQQAIIKAVLDHAVIAPAAPGAIRLDINRVRPHWRI
jgi:site-specific DNA recombinase